MKIVESLHEIHQCPLFIGIILLTLGIMNNEMVWLAGGAGGDIYKAAITVNNLMCLLTATVFLANHTHFINM